MQVQQISHLNAAYYVDVFDVVMVVTLIKVVPCIVRVDVICNERNEAEDYDLVESKK